MKKVTFLLPVLLLIFPSAKPAKTPIKWKEIDNGLLYAEISSPVKSSHGDSKISVLKIDPKQYNLKMVCASEEKTINKAIDQWSKAKNLLAAVNAGMYKLDGDYTQCTGYLQNYNHINNGVLNRTYNAVAAFSPKSDTVPPFKIIDLRCESWDQWKNAYNCYSQGIRMIDCNQTNRWSVQAKKWSMVTFAVDKAGNALFIFTRSPYRVHDFINILLGLDLDIYNMMYLEGGPEASFYLNHKGTKVEKYGSYETGFWENDNNAKFWEIPNVIGVVKK